jgi:hypothetical protein
VSWLRVNGQVWFERLQEPAKRRVESFATWYLVSIICAVILAWAGRSQLNPDGLSYLDIGYRAATRGTAELVSGYWSPAYPGLIAVALALVRPSPPAAIALLHILNVLIFAFTLSTFGALVATLLHGNEPGKKHRHPLAVAFVATAFLCLTLQYLGPEVVTPDLLVAGILFLVFRVAWRLSLAPFYARYVQLGLALAAGYYAKTSMFVLALVLLLLLAFAAARKRVSGTGVAISAMIFLASSAPLVALVSARVGHPSIGESGPLNYVWYVGHRELTRNEGWSGRFPNTETLPHAPSILAEHPLALGFAAPIPGTFPIWYAPDYWWNGAKPTFNLTGQLHALRDSMLNYAGMLPVLAPWGVGLVGLWFFARRHKIVRLGPRAVAWPVLWPLATLALFSVVHVEGRFLVPFFVLFFAYSYRILSGLVPPRAAGAIVIGISTLAMMIVSAQVALAVYRGVRQIVRHQVPDYVLVGRELQALRLQPGVGLGVVGYAFDAYYAWNSGTRVIAQMPDADAFWQSSIAERDALLQTLAANGVEAIIAQDPPQHMALSGWHEVRTANSRFVVRTLPARASAH